MLKTALACLFAAGVLPAHAQSAAWAFPGARTPGERVDSTGPRHVRNSTRAFSLGEALNPYAPVDWRPGSHPTPPTIVVKGVARRVPACGYCHLPDGQGRSENATLAGLPRDYIVRQIEDMRAGRRGAVGDWRPSKGMKAIADSVSDADLRAAARYFSRLQATPRYLVVESPTAPATYSLGWLLAAKPEAPKETLGDRIVEISNDPEGHELHDPGETFTSFVPVGSIERGRRIANARGAKAPTACVTCHGPGLRGRPPAPPIAGRSPLYIVRQLLAFKTGARNGTAAGPMQAVVTDMSIDDMIAAAAYAGSRKP